MLKRLSFIMVSTWLASCSTSSYTEKTDTHTVTVSFDTTLVLPVEMVDTVVTSENVSGDWIIWTSDERQNDKPKIQAARNAKTGKTIVQAQDSTKLTVSGSKTTTDQTQEKNKETVSWLSELRPVLMWGGVCLTGLVALVLVLHKRLGL